MSGRTAYVAVLGGDRCVYCGARVEHIDHITARARGGKDEWGNLAGACATCNLEKATADPLWFLLRRIARREAPKATPGLPEGVKRTRRAMTPEAAAARRMAPGGADVVVLPTDVATAFLGGALRSGGSVTLTCAEDLLERPVRPFGKLDGAFLQTLREAAERHDTTRLHVDLAAVAATLSLPAPNHQGARRLAASAERMLTWGIRLGGTQMCVLTSLVRRRDVPHVRQLDLNDSLIGAPRRPGRPVRTRGIGPAEPFDPVRGEYPHNWWDTEPERLLALS